MKPQNAFRFLWPFFLLLGLYLFIAFVTSCASIPRVIIHGAYGDYQYSSKSGLEITPKYPIEIHADK